VVLVFDEVRTCFRLAMGGAQALYGVTPDLTVLGKGMANGYAISVVTGKAEVMMAASQKLFISSTFFPNSDGYIAALKTIEILERDNVLDKIWAKGRRFMKSIQGSIDRHNAGAELSGVAPMFFITFKKDKGDTQRGRRTDFYTQLIRKGVFLTPHHHGYICYRHTEEDLDIAAKAIDESMEFIAAKYRYEPL
jgi:glutamate-1-semialdehyde aminotransferase